MTRDEVASAVIARIFAREGGVADIGDGKGETRWGQTTGWLAQWRFPVPTSKDEAAMNYRSWLDRTNLDALCTVDDVLADVVIDFAVNSGERVAIAALQRALGTARDGVLGPQTEKLLATVNRREAACHVLAKRLELDGRLITDHPHQYAAFARGWLTRIGAQVRALA